ncbi:ABC-type Fe3+-hydroxamate transport system, periplasmic component [Methanocella conradii HZ254]|uniref:ABC-type Fe3+-hydroxamate transport system, periplasmic component n=1 Tax=Methanocella conradii (strain DSM 24694 / JCM 17849 / CGMCC 1.5162 / HZ254) TaxID=1041930 RepID=H8I8W9_METCZ|nr:ABC transporter substrate-binding protein [Methanocella conradii]AFD00440.1 ABC-type Fe3+-hydroxamate transport system, periplasmic component [Methanocella conradii HZ254]
MATKLRLLASCALLLIIIMSAGCTQTSNPTPTPVVTHESAVKFIDSSGIEITLPHEARRIIATNSDCAEMLIAIGAGDRIVGVSDTVINNKLLMQQLPANVANVGSWSTPNVEVMASLKPDVIVCYAYANKPKNIEEIWAANLTIVSLDCYKLSTLTADARALGMMTGKSEKAEEYVAFLEKYLKMVKDRTAKLNASERPLVYWESYTAYSTVGKNAAGDQMIAFTGGANIAGDNTTTYPKVNAEWIINRNPSFIIKTFSANDVSTSEDAGRILSGVTSRPGFEKVDAVKSGHVYAMSGNIASGARSIIGIVYLAKLFHPELYEDIDPNAVLKEYAEKYVPGADKAIYVYPPISS